MFGIFFVCQFEVFLVQKLLDYSYHATLIEICEF